jgi:enoyl-CoA hydratase
MNTLNPADPDQDGRAVSIQKTHGVAVITLCNPGRKNALTPDIADQFVEALSEVDADLTVGSLVVKGANGTFCSGADLSSLSAAMVDPASEGSYDALDRIYRAFTRLGEMGVPTIAALRGSAVGAGVNLAMAADLRIVSESARIISGFAKLGLTRAEDISSFLFKDRAAKPLRQWGSSPRR